ncbi:MAG: glycosyltransferase [Bacteroidia bacterium]|nr:glycosyltransferase [Bacteroidia bacterium]
MSETPPTISVITVVKNQPDDLEKTIRSMVVQDYPEVEYIVVDGGSGEETLEVIRSHEARITYWISEKDRGLYDAMNKGAALASGQWINFMNAGDTFFNPDTLSGLFNKNLNEVDILYGDYIADYGIFKVLRESRPVSGLWRGMGICHQALFIRADLIRSHPFNPGFPIGADLDQLFRLFTDEKRFLHVPVPVAVFDARGISNRQMIRAAHEHYRIVKMYHSLSFREQAYHFRFLLEVSLATLAHRIVPENLMMRMLKRINRLNLVEE